MHVMIKNNINNNIGIGKTSKKKECIGKWSPTRKNTKKLSSTVERVLRTMGSTTKDNLVYCKWSPTTEGIDIIVHEMEGNEWKAMNDGRQWMEGNEWWKAFFTIQVK